MECFGLFMKMDMNLVLAVKDAHCLPFESPPSRANMTCYGQRFKLQHLNFKFKFKMSVSISFWKGFGLLEALARTTM